jgi:hypothetical protein
VPLSVAAFENTTQTNQRFYPFGCFQLLIFVLSKYFWNFFFKTSHKFLYVPLYYQLSIISIISLIEVKKIWCLTSEYMSQEERQLKNLIKIIYSILH